MKNIRNVLEGIYSDKELRETIVPLFMGNPGLGKTVIINQFVKFAKEKKVKFVDFFGTTNIDPSLTEMITSQMSPFEISGIAIPDKELKQMVFYNLNKLDSLKTGDILFFDELPNGNPTVLNACLTLLESRVMMSGKKLPDIMIVAAGNYQGMVPMTPQIKERFVWYNVEFDKGMWVDYMQNKYSPQLTLQSKSIYNKLASLITSEDFSGYNFITPRSIDKAVNMIIKGVYTPYERELGPILHKLIKNPFKEKVELPDGTTLKENETISWLKLIRLIKGIDMSKFKVKNIIETKSTSDFEINILDEDDNIMGTIRDIETLKRMYGFDSGVIEKLRKGRKVTLHPPLAFQRFFLKKIT